MFLTHNTDCRIALNNGLKESFHLMSSTSRKVVKGERKPEIITLPRPNLAASMHGHTALKTLWWIKMTQ